MAFLGAHVGSDGTVINGAGTTGASKLATGTYQIDFNRDVTSCFYNAVSFNNTVPFSAEPRAGDPNSVFILFSTLGSTSASPNLTDSEFYLTVFCSK